jgi:hypothetical protein
MAEVLLWRSFGLLVYLFKFSMFCWRKGCLSESFPPSNSPSSFLGHWKLWLHAKSSIMLLCRGAMMYAVLTADYLYWMTCIFLLKTGTFVRFPCKLPKSSLISSKTCVILFQINEKKTGCDSFVIDVAVWFIGVIMLSFFNHYLFDSIVVIISPIIRNYYVFWYFSSLSVYM